MSEEQLSALLAKLKEDAGLQAKFKDAANLDAALAIAKEAGFDVGKADWLAMAQQSLELGDDELEQVAGGAVMDWYPEAYEANKELIRNSKVRYCIRDGY